MSKLFRHIQTRHRPSSHEHSEPIIGSRSPSGWHVMPVPQPLLGQRSPCSGCQALSLPSSACPPCSRGLRLRREAALLGKAFLSERICMPSSLDCSSVSRFCCWFCSFSLSPSTFSSSTAIPGQFSPTHLEINSSLTSLRIPWAWQAHRPDLIRSPKQVLAHLWEVSQE